MKPIKRYIRMIGKPKRTLPAQVMKPEQPTTFTVPSHVPMVFPGPTPEEKHANGTFRYSEGIRAKRNIETTPLIDGIAIICEKLPLAGSVLKDFELNVVQTGTEQYEVFEQKLDARRYASNRIAESNNRPIDEEISDVEDWCEEALGVVEKKLDDLRPKVWEAHRGAAEVIGRCGRQYAPANPQNGILLAKEKPLEVIAGTQRLAYSKLDSTLSKYAWLLWVLSVITGAAMGISAGLMSGALDVTILAAQILPCTVWASIGTTVSIFGKYLVFLLGGLCAELTHGEATIAQRRAVWAIALVVTAGCLSISIVVERQGLLSIRSLNAMIMGLSGNAASVEPGLWSTIASILSAALLAFPYLLWSGVEGYCASRKILIEDALLARQAEVFEADQEAERNDSKIQDALVAANQVVVLQAQEKELASDAAQIKAKANTKTQVLNGKRLPVEHKRSAEDQSLLTKMYWQVIGLHTKLREMLFKLGAAVEPGPLWGEARRGRMFWQVWRYFTHAEHDGPPPPWFFFILILIAAAVLFAFLFHRGS